MATTTIAPDDGQQSLVHKSQYVMALLLLSPIADFGLICVPPLPFGVGVHPSHFRRESFDKVRDVFALAVIDEPDNNHNNSPNNQQLSGSRNRIPCTAISAPGMGE